MSEERAKKLICEMTEEELKDLYVAITGKEPPEGKIRAIQGICPIKHPTESEKETIKADLRYSISEEQKAVSDYDKRAATAESYGDGKTVELYEHVAHEETVHEKEFQERLGEL
jgi:bacterioferritin (cytochrome b1)